MPWKETSPVEERERFVREWLREQIPKSRLCAMYGISRKTGYKWIERFMEGGLSALSDQRRSPKSHPLYTSESTKSRIIALRKAHPTWGPKKLRRLLEDEPDIGRVPAVSTVGKILKDNGLVERRRRRLPAIERRVHLKPAKEPNELWSVDFKGQFRMGNGDYNYPLTLSDNVSRYLFTCHGLMGTGFVEVQQVFNVVFEVFGLPERIRSDNGIPFSSSQAIAGLSQLSVWFLKLGVWPELTRKGKPQDNGRHERMHRTLKAETTRPPGANVEEQQELFDAFVKEYNEIRPHEALGQETPASVYRPSPRKFEGTPDEFEYPKHFETRKLDCQGYFKWKGKGVYFSQAAKKERIGFLEIDDDLWEIHVGALIAGHFDARSRKMRPAPSASQSVAGEEG